MRKQALCVGINRYKNYPQDTLRYCVSDARAMSAWFQSRLGFKPNEITVIEDAQATKGNVIAALTNMVALAKAGNLDYLAWTQSGHGTQVKDHSGLDADGLSEALCFYDIAEKDDDWDPATIGIDHELHALFVSLPIPVRLEVWFDSCHSGGGLKLLRHFHRRFLALPERQDQYFPTSAQRFARLLEREGSYGGGVLWAACGSDQTSADGYGSKPNGAFTGSFLANYQAGITRHDLINRCKTDLRGQGYDQVPRVQCSDAIAMMACGA